MSRLRAITFSFWVLLSEGKSHKSSALESGFE